MGAIRPGGSLAPTAASIAALLVAAFALLTGGEKASMLGLTRHGELAVAVDAGGADVVALTAITPGTPTQVLTVSDSGVPVWRTPTASAAGPTAGSGTYAARPATPALGDSYTVTSGARTGSVYRCASAGVWTLAEILAPTAVVPSLRWDPERLEPNQGGVLLSWRDEQVSAVLAGQSLGAVSPTILSAATAGWGALPVASWAANAGTLLCPSQGPTWALPRTLVLVVSSVSTAATRVIAGWGRAASTLGVFSVTTAAAGTGFSLYGYDPVGTGPTPTTSSATIIVATFNGTHVRLRQAPLVSGTLTWVESLASTAAALTTSGNPSGIVVGARPDNGTTYPFQGRVHTIVVYDSVLSDGAMESVGTALAARLGAT